MRRDPTEFRKRFAAYKLGKSPYLAGRPVEDDSWTMQDEAGYIEWRNSLPDNLRNTDDNEYDMRTAYKSGAQPALYEDGYYHLPSRDPRTGLILKAAHHPTFGMALREDAALGYYPRTIKGKTYTSRFKGLDIPKYNDGKEDIDSVYHYTPEEASSITGRPVLLFKNMKQDVIDDGVLKYIAHKQSSEQLSLRYDRHNKELLTARANGFNKARQVISFVNDAITSNKDFRAGVQVALQRQILDAQLQAEPYIRMFRDVLPQAFEIMNAGFGLVNRFAIGNKTAGLTSLALGEALDAYQTYSAIDRGDYSDATKNIVQMGLGGLGTVGYTDVLRNIPGNFNIFGKTIPRGVAMDKLSDFSGILGDVWDVSPIYDVQKHTIRLFPAKKK